MYPQAGGTPDAMSGGMPGSGMPVVMPGGMPGGTDGGTAGGPPLKKLTKRTFNCVHDKIKLADFEFWLKTSLADFEF